MLWSRLNLDNANATAVKIAQAELTAICRAVGVLAPNDSTDLHDLPLVIAVKCKKRADTDEITNEIKGYSPKAALAAAQCLPSPLCHPLTASRPPRRGSAERFV